MIAPSYVPRDRDADRAQAERLVGELYKQVTLVNESMELELDPIILAQMTRMRDDLRFSADLLFAYQAGLAVTVPDPATGCFLVERIAVTDGLPDSSETVLLWVAPESGLEDGPYMGYWDQGWWMLDSSIATHVTSWARRPGVGQ